MYVYEYIMKYDFKEIAKPFIMKEENMKRIREVEGLEDYYFSIGAGGYHNCLCYKPWDGDDMTPSIYNDEMTIYQFLASRFHNLVFEDCGMSDLTYYEETDFMKDCEPTNTKEMLEANSYVIAQFKELISKSRD